MGVQPDDDLFRPKGLLERIGHGGQPTGHVALVGKGTERSVEKLEFFALLTLLKAGPEREEGDPRRWHDQRKHRRINLRRPDDEYTETSCRDRRAARERERTAERPEVRPTVVDGHRYVDGERSEHSGGENAGEG